MKFVRLIKAEEKFDKSKYHEVFSDIQFMWNSINESGKATDEDKKMLVDILKRTWNMSMPEVKKAVDDFEHSAGGSLDLQEIESSKTQSNDVKLIKTENKLKIEETGNGVWEIDVPEIGGGQILKVNKYSTLDAVSNYEVILWNKDGEMLPKKYVDSLREAKTLIINYLKSQKQ